MFTLKVKRLERTGPQEEKGHFQELREGILYAWRHPFLKALIFAYSFFMFFVTPAALITPLLVTRTFGDEVWRLTLNEMLFGIGSILGGVVIASWGGFRNRLRTIGLFSILFGLLTAALGIPQNFWSYLFFMLLTGTCIPVSYTHLLILYGEGDIFRLRTVS